MTDEYQHKAREFRNAAEIGPEFRDLDHAVQGHWRVAQEEMDELDDEVQALLVAYQGTDHQQITLHDAHYDRLAEEIADVLVTIHVLADMLDIDARKAYKKKMEYNMNKSGDKDDNGKVTDDTDIEKPNFGDCYNE